MGPALQVTHLMAFSLTKKSPTFKLVRLPAGPTLSFRVERYSLMKDVQNSRKRKRSIGMEYLAPPLVRLLRLFTEANCSRFHNDVVQTPPLPTPRRTSVCSDRLFQLILAAFPPAGPGTPPYLPLLMKSFQSVFPPLSPQTIPLASCRRVVLVHYNADRDTVDLRHYLITVRAQGISRHVQKILEGSKSVRGGSVLDLGREQDVADYILRQGGYESASSAVSDVGEDAEETKIELAGDYVGRNNRKGEQRSVRLDEVGPRMELRLLKITEGTPGKEGAVIWHRFGKCEQGLGRSTSRTSDAYNAFSFSVKKTAAEIKALSVSHAQQERLRKQRRAEQEANIARKQAATLGTDTTSSAIGVDNDNLAGEDTSSESEWDDGEAIEPSASEGSLSETDNESG